MDWYTGYTSFLTELFIYIEREREWLFKQRIISNQYGTKKWCIDLLSTQRIYDKKGGIALLECFPKGYKPIFTAWFDENHG